MTPRAVSTYWSFVSTWTSHVTSNDYKILLQLTDSQGRDSAREFVVLEVTSYATTHKQLAKTTVVVACLVLACDWTPCVPFVIQVLRVFYSYPSTLHYHYRGLFIYVKAYWGLNYSVNKKINVYLPSFIARTTVNRCQSSVVDFEPDYVTRQGQGENQARNCSRKRLWGEPEHVTIDNRHRRNLALSGLVG